MHFWVCLTLFRLSTNFQYVIMCSCRLLILKVIWYSYRAADHPSVINVSPCAPRMFSQAVVSSYRPEMHLPESAWCWSFSVSMPVDYTAYSIEYDRKSLCHTCLSVVLHASSLSFWYSKCMHLFMLGAGSSKVSLYIMFISLVLYPHKIQVVL